MRSQYIQYKKIILVRVRKSMGSEHFVNSNWFSSVITKFLFEMINYDYESVRNF